MDKNLSLMPDVSIVIPCYNSGKYLPDAIASITGYKGKHSYEVIIVNDGSTDTLTLELLNKLQHNGYTILHQKNQGPAAARNAGVKAAQSDYILFLDSDNKIRSTVFIDTGISMLGSQPDAGVVYGNAAFFGDVNKDRVFESGPFEMERMLRLNYIDMCSMVRKATWQQVGGLDENRLVIGHEDWDFWLRIGRTAWKFYYCNQVFFDYRIMGGSLITQATNLSHYSSMVNYILAKQSDILPACFNHLSYEFSCLQALRKQEAKSPLRTFIKNILMNSGLKRKTET